MRKQSRPLEVADLALLANVVERRSFSGAAQAVGTTTSGASKRMARLEGRLGARLFERTTRRVVPTEAGAAFYARAKRILSDLEAAENELASLGGAPRGTLRVSAPLIFGERHLAPLLPGFLARYPAVRIELSLSDAFVDLLAERFDVALRIGPLADSTLKRVRIGSAASVVVAAPSYLARRGRPASPSDLVRHDLVRFSQIPASREWRFRGKRGVLTIPAIGTLEVNHGGAMREAVIAGIGIAKLPDFQVSDALRAGELVRLLDEFALPPAGVHLVYPTGATPLPKLDVFVTQIGAALKARLAAVQRAATRT